MEQERLEQERLEKERLEQERLEKEQLELERLEKERHEKEQLEDERLEQERQAKERSAFVRRQKAEERRPHSPLSTEQRPGNKTGQEDDSPLAALALKQQSEHEKVRQSLLAEQERLSSLTSSSPPPTDSREARLQALIDSKHEERASAISLALKLEEQNQAISTAQLLSRPKSGSPPPKTPKTGLEAAEQLESSYASILEGAAALKHEAHSGSASKSTLNSSSSSSRIPRLSRQLSSTFKSFKGMSLKSRSKSPRAGNINDADDWSTGTSEFMPQPTPPFSPNLSKSVNLNTSLSPDDMESAVLSSIAAIGEEQKRIKSKKKMTAKIASNAKKVGRRLYQAGKDASASLK